MYKHKDHVYEFFQGPDAPFFLSHRSSTLDTLINILPPYVSINFTMREQKRYTTDSMVSKTDSNLSVKNLLMKEGIEYK